MIAIISDIHANIHALDAVLRDMPKVSEIWVLGDTIGGGPFSCEVFERLLNLTTPVKAILGNWEEHMLEVRQGGHPDWWESSRYAFLSIAWTVANLKPYHWEYLDGLKNTLELDSIPGGVLLYHGSPYDSGAGIETFETAAAVAEKYKQQWLFGGHIHKTRLFRVGQQRIAAVGSVGLSDDKICGGVAAYTLFDGENLVFRHVAYDVDTAAAAFLKSEYAENNDPAITRACIATMYSGQNYLAHYIDFVMDYSVKRLGNEIKKFDEVPVDLREEASKAWRLDDWLEAKFK